MRSIGLGIVLVWVAACSSAAPPQQPAGEPGSWQGQTSHAPPAVGHPVGLWLEYLPGTDPQDTEAARSPAIHFTARCATCSPAVSAVAGMTTLAEHDADDLLNPEAVAAHSAAITFPAAGEWTIEPFDVVVRVRAIDPYEPPVLHAQPWSEPLPAGCTREKIAQILRSFIAGLNGDENALASVSGPFYSLSLDGRPPVGMVASSPAEVMELARGLWRAGDRFELVRAEYSYPGGQYSEVTLAPVVLRTVRVGDHHETRRMLGKAGMWCSQGGMMHWNMAGSGSP